MNIAPYIDHTVLKPTTIAADVEKLCSEAIEFGFAAVCVPPPYVRFANNLVKNSPVKVATVIGFPFGYSSIDAKVAEVNQAIADGADELDIVINLTALMGSNFDYLSKEINSCLQPIRLNNKVVKVIIESGILLDEAIVACCELYSRHKVDFIKTSTGYAEKGASVHAVKLIKNNIPPEILIKASGGIRTFEFAKELIDAGANRIGASASVAIVKDN